MISSRKIWIISSGNVPKVAVRACHDLSLRKSSRVPTENSETVTNVIIQWSQISHGLITEGGRVFLDSPRERVNHPNSNRVAEPKIAIRTQSNTVRMTQ